MPRRLLLLAAFAAAAPSTAQTSAPYYGPGKHWLGIGYKFGYMDKEEKDGSWRIEARVRRGEAVNLAMYRAAERARDGGYRYVQFLRATQQFITYGIGYGRARAGAGTPTGFATVWARPTNSPAPPPGCTPMHLAAHVLLSCYTADAGEVLRVLGGPYGNQPGIAIADHHDRFGRAVLLAPFGIGAVDGRGQPIPRTAAVPGAITPVPVPATSLAGAVLRHMMPGSGAPTAAAVQTASALPSGASDGGSSSIETQARFEAARAAQQPVRGRDAKQGWTISD